VGISRIYGPEAFGQFTTAHAIMTFFLILADLGLDTLLALEVARSQTTAPSVLTAYAAVKVAIAAAATIIIVVIGLMQPFDETTSMLIVILGASVIFSALMSFEFALLRGLEQLHHEAQITLAINAAALLLLVLAGMLEASLLVVATVYGLTRVAGYFLARRRATRVMGSARKPLTFQGWRSGRGTVMTFAAYLLFGYLFFQLDTLLLAALRGSADVGVYQSVFKVAVVALVIPDVAVAAMLPTLARLHTNAPDQWLAQGELMGKILLLIGLPISLVMFAYPEWVLSVLYGAGVFPEAPTVMRIFAGVVWIRFAVETSGLLLTTSGNQHSRVLIIGIATGVNAAANLLAIPLLGPTGAAFVSLGTNLLVGGGYILAVRRRYQLKVVNWRSGTVIALTAIMAGALYAFRSVPLCATLPAGVGATMLLGYYLGLTQAERQALVSIRIPRLG